MTSSSKRALILDSAAHIVEMRGAAHLTMEAVATAAGVSKGGLLYHFPSKQALLEGMLERLLAQMAARENAHRGAQHSGRNAALIGHIMEEHDQDPSERAMSRAILAAAAENPELLTPARTFIQQAFRDAAAESKPREMGWVLVLAVEGLRLLEMLNLLPVTAAERRRIHLQLLALARSHSA